MLGENAPPKIAHWTLSDQQALTALQNAVQLPLPGSPLLDLADRTPSQNTPPPNSPAFAAAWERLLRPDYILQFRVNPSLDPTQSTRHYAFTGDSRFVRYRRATSGGHHLEWPHTTESLLAVCDNVLGEAAPVEPALDSLTLDQDGYAALLAAGDCIHEETLHAALERREPQPVQLTAEVMQRCFQRAAGGIGLLWLSGRGVQFAPGRLAPPLEALQRGLDALTRQGLLAVDNEIRSPTAAFSRLSSQLSGDASFVSLAQRRRTVDEAGQIGWEKRYLTVMRTQAPFWLLTFEPVKPGAFTVQLSAASRADMREQLRAALTPPEARADRPRPAPPTVIAGVAPPPLSEPPSPPTMIQAAAAETDWYVRAERGERTGVRFDIVDQLRIGREADCNVRLTSDTVSRHHAVLLMRSHGLVARDLKSTNGTFVNGVKITEDVTLKKGDILDVGETRLRVNGPSTPPATPSVAPMAPPPTYVAPGRPGGQPDPLAAASAAESPPLPAAPAANATAPPKERLTQGWLIALISAAVSLCVGLTLLAGLYYTGLLTLP